MSVAALFEMPRDTKSLMSWSFAHAAHHRDINRLIYQTYGRTLAQYALDPFDPDNMETWLHQHQIMHQNQNATLNIQGYDLNSVTWSDTRSLSAWLQANGNEHVQAGRILKLG